MNIRLKKFDMRNIKDDSTVVMLGKRNTGKSVLVRDLLFYKKHLPIGTVISATESANGFYQSHVPSNLIHEEFQSDLIKGVLQRQVLMMQKNEQEIKQYGKARTDPKCFLILDDCLFDNTWARTKEMRYVFMNGRHLKILTIITMQYPLGIPPVLRTNIDYVFILRENVVANRKRIFEQYAGMFPSFDMFCQIMDQCTENYECLVVHNGARSNKIEDQVFWYKADVHNEFRLCSPDLWKKPEAHRIHSAGWLSSGGGGGTSEDGSKSLRTQGKGISNF